MFRKIRLAITSTIHSISTKLEKTFSEDHLIVFDRKTIVLLFSLLLLFLSLTALKIHGSSITIWNELLPNATQNYKEGVIYGKPKSVRSDEWIVNTPFAMSQALKNDSYSLENETLGGGNVPLLTNLPVKHISALFRPEHWGYFVLGVERGFAYFWNFKFLSMISGFFLLFMLLTKNKFWISLFGSIWIYASSFTQWWYSSAAGLMGIAALIFVGIIYILFSKKKLNIILGTILVTIFGVDFILFIYPPYQVQLGYLVLFLLVGYAIGHQTWDTLKVHWETRVTAIALGLVVALPVLYKYYLDAKDTISMVMGTVYPGERVSVGGGLTLSRYFSGYYSALLRDGHVPQSFLNASEASNFIFFYPIVAVVYLYNLFKKRKNDAVIVMMLLYIFIITLWMKFGFPLAISKATLLSYAPTERCYMGLGLASVILSVVFLGKLEPVIKEKKQIIASALVVFGLLLSYGLYLNAHTANYFQWYWIAIVTIIFSLASILFLTKQRFLFAGIILFMTIGPAIFINPISIGLQPILGKEVISVINEQKRQYPNAKWAVYGNRLLPNFFIASGASVIDGVKYTPPLETLSLLDPDKEYELIWNRYAHTYFGQTGVTVDQIKFTLVYADLYKVSIDPCNPTLRRLGVTHLAFDKKPSDDILACSVPIADHPINKIWLYRYK